jgi:hypothetical protein
MNIKQFIATIERRPKAVNTVRNQEITVKLWDIFCVTGKKHEWMGVVGAPHEPAALLQAVFRFNVVGEAEQKKLIAIRRDAGPVHKVKPMGGGKR